MSIPGPLAIPVVFAMSLISCAITPPVTGPAAAAISASDVRDIKSLVAERGDIKQGALSINAERSDRVLVRSGSQSSDGADYSEFTVTKVHDHWRIVHGHWHISSPIQQRHVYPTG